MTRLATFFIALFFLWSCGDKEIEVPEGILPPLKMQQVLWDVIKADELASLQSSLDTTINQKQKSIELYAQVFKIHKVREPEFKRSFTYYKKNPVQLKTIFDSLRNIPEKPATPRQSKPVVKSN